MKNITKYILAFSIGLGSSVNIKSDPLTAIGLCLLKIAPSLPVLGGTLASIFGSYKIFEWMHAKEHRKTRQEIGMVRQDVSAVNQSVSCVDTRLCKFARNQHEDNSRARDERTGIGASVTTLDGRVRDTGEATQALLMRQGRNLRGLHVLASAALRTVDENELAARARFHLSQETQAGMSERLQRLSTSVDEIRATMARGVAAQFPQGQLEQLQSCTQHISTLLGLCQQAGLEGAQAVQRGTEQLGGNRAFFTPIESEFGTQTMSDGRFSTEGLLPFSSVGCPGQTMALVPAYSLGGSPRSQDRVPSAGGDSITSTVDDLPLD